MTEPTTPPSEPATAPVVTPSPPAAAGYQEPQRRSRLTAIAAWVGIVAGVVFIVAVVFFSGFILGRNADGHHGGHRGDHDVAIFHRGGPPPMFPWGPRGESERPPFGGPGGPGMQPPQSPQSPSAPTTTTTPRP